MTDHGRKQYEVEIKSLIGDDKDLLQRVREQLGGKFDTIVRHDDQKQLNHYFNSDGDFSKLGQKIRVHLSDDEYEDYVELVGDAASISLRTREIDGSHVIFVMKLSLGKDSDDHGLARREFEITVPVLLDELDALILDAAFTYKSKWSRERETYVIDDRNMTVTIDKNAGYGYLVECEKVTHDEGNAENLRKDILEVMSILGIEEIDQDRIGRMFSHYNEHWQDYYGTDKTFSLE